MADETKERTTDHALGSRAVADDTAIRPNADVESRHEERAPVQSALGGQSVSDLWKRRTDYTDEASKAARGLAVVLGALAWKDFASSHQISAALLFAVAFFACDVLHYYVPSWVLWFFLRKEEKAYLAEHGHLSDFRVDVPRSIDVPAHVLFNVKIAFVFVGFVSFAAKSF